MSKASTGKVLDFEQLCLDFASKRSVYAVMTNDLKNLPLDELRSRWARAWGKQPHGTMGRAMIVESLKFKLREQDTGGLHLEQKLRLDEIISAYKRNPDHFDKATKLKLGTRLVRTWKGKKYCVTVTRDGFEYEGKIYSSLSHVANTITGTRWNGWLFFGIK